MFTISTQVRYALRGLIRLAEREATEPVSISQIAEEEDISKKYLENIFKLLKRGGIVRSLRGPVGGYTLTRKPEEINLAEIIEAVEGRISVVECLESPEICERITGCLTRSVWEELQRNMKEYCASKTLESIRAKEYAGAADE
jgi:Rrf2 family protein